MKKISLLICLVLSANYISAQNADVFIQLGHTSEITAVDVSPDGNFAVSSDYEGNVIYWDIATRNEIMRFVDHKNTVWDVKFSPDGRFILTVGDDSMLNYWSVESREELDHGLMSGELILNHFHPKYDSYTQVSFLPDGSSAIAGDEYGYLYLIDLNTGDIISEFGYEDEHGDFIGHSDEIKAIAVSPDGRKLLSADKEDILVWDIISGKKIVFFDEFYDWPNSVAISPDSRMGIAGFDDEIVILFDLETGDEIYTFEGHVDAVNSVKFSPDGNQIISAGEDGNMILWEVQTGREIQRFTGSNTYIADVTFLPEGNQVISGGGDNILKLWDVGTGTVLKTYSSFAQPLTSIDISVDGKYSITAENRNSLISVWDNQRSEQIKMFRGVKEARFSPDGEFIAIINPERTGLNIYDIRTGDIIHSLSEHSGYLNTISISPDGRYVAAGGWDGDVYIWNSSTGALKESFILSNSQGNFIVYALEFSTDSRSLAAGTPGRYAAGEGGNIQFESDNLHILDVTSGDILEVINTGTNFVYSLNYSPDGSYLVSGSDRGVIKNWSTNTYEELNSFTCNNPLDDCWTLEDVRSVQFSPDGNYLLSAGNNNVITLWDVSNGESIKSFIGHTSSVNGLRFLNDGNYFISVGNDGTLRRWELESGEQIALAAAREDGWVTMVPEGYFITSENGSDFIKIRLEDDVLSIDNFFDTYYRPDIVRAKLAGEDITPLIDADIRNVTQLPPSVRFTSPGAGHSTSSQTITISAEITDRGSGIGEIRLMHNGSNISGELRAFRMAPGQGQTVTRKFEVPLLPGENRFRLTAFNDTRIESNPAELMVTYEGAARESDLYIIAVGIDEYQNSRYNLNYGRSDAEAFASIFELKAGRIYNNVHVTRIYDADATRATIQAAFEQVQQRARPEDTFKFFYAGHGVVNEPDNPSERPDFFMALHDVTQLYGQDQQLRERGVSAGELTTWVSDVQARRQMVVFDACQAGGAIDAFAYRGAAEERAIQQLARSAGVAIIASAESEQFATEFARLGHGVFTYAMLNGLRGDALMGGGSGSITVQQLIAYINQAVPDLTLQHRGQTQYPVSFSRGQDFPLLVME